MKLTVTAFVSLDGVMQGPGGPDEDAREGFDLGGWLIPYVDEDFSAIVAEQFATADAFLLGRGTYEAMARHWPQVTDPSDPVAGALNTLPKHVASATLATAEWANTTILAGDVVDAVRQLRSRPGRDLQVHGSHQLVQTLARHRLVDEYRLWVFPVILAKGRRLFADGAVPTACEHLDTRVTGQGVAVHRYRPNGLPTHGRAEVLDGVSVTSP